MEYLEGVEVDELGCWTRLSACRSNGSTGPQLDFRGFAGTIVSGTVAPGDEVVIAPSGREQPVERIVTADGDLEQRPPGRR